MLVAGWLTSLDGVLVVAKEPGPTSHDIVALVRRLTGVKRVGHGGTLDPFAAGVLPVFVGHATRLVEYHLARCQGIPRHRVLRRALDDRRSRRRADARPMTPAPTRDDGRAALAAFRGEIEQVPPDYSAVRVAGRKAYELARHGEKPELRARHVTVTRLELTELGRQRPAAARRAARDALLGGDVRPRAGPRPGRDARLWRVPGRADAHRQRPVPARAGAPARRGPRGAVAGPRARAAAAHGRRAGLPGSDAQRRRGDASCARPAAAARDRTRAWSASSTNPGAWWPSRAPATACSSRRRCSARERACTTSTSCRRPALRARDRHVRRRSSRSRARDRGADEGRGRARCGCRSC